jgi:hypothetical protein
MNTPILTSRFDCIAASRDHTHPRLEWHRDGFRIVCRTSDRYVQTRRLFVQLFGIAIIVVGLALINTSRWGIALVVARFAVFALVPRFVRVSDLLLIDASAGEIVVLQRAATTGAHFPITDVQSIEGVYSIQGWDGDSTIYAVRSDETRSPILVFPGTNEALARCACRTLGALLDCPATYTGAFDDATVCYQPEGADTVYAS